MFYHLIFNERNKINTLKDETLVNGFNANIYNFISSTIYKNFHSDFVKFIIIHSTSILLCWT